MGSEQKNALAAVVLSGLILFGWQYYFAPPKPAPAPIEPIATSGNVTKTEISNAKKAESPAAPIEPVSNETFDLKEGKTLITFDNTLAVTSFVHPQAGLPFEDIVGSQVPLRVQFDFGNGFEALHFSPTEQPYKYMNADHEVTLTTGLDEKGRGSFTLTSPHAFKYRFVFRSEELKLENNQERFFAFYTDKLMKEKPGSEEAGDRAIKWAGIDFNYHLFALYFDKEPNLLYKTSPDNTFSIYSNKAEKELSYHLVYARKEYNYLTSLDHKLNQSVDFGIWGFFAVWILKGLQFFYKFIPNWGVAIILLTLLMRLLTFPLQYKSYVSMKKLQLVQPELTKIREKYKDDPQKMQKESMELFRKSGANPVGGCLPLVLQMPVFFAFYRVLYAAVELVDAPFVFWIRDLSNKDPYFVLPALMTVAMFLQQKLTPNTVTDPMQKKVMLFMPLIFGFIMKDLPSGLSLYIFVSTIFGILQQMLVFKKKTTALAV